MTYLNKHHHKTNKQIKQRACGTNNNFKKNSDLKNQKEFSNCTVQGTAALAEENSKKIERSEIYKKRKKSRTN